VGALLHDMGISILHRYFNPEFRRIVEMAREMKMPFLEAEESVLGVTHADVGGWLAARWNLPDHLIEAMSLHHAPASATINPDLVALVHCADVFVNRIQPEPIEFDSGLEFDQDALGRLRLMDPAVLEGYVNGYKEMFSREIEEATTRAASMSSMSQ